MTEKDKYQLLLDELIGPLKGFVTTLTKKSELLANKVKSIIGNEDSDEKYPTVKAVYDFVNEVLKNVSDGGSVEIPENVETTDNKVQTIDENSTDEQYASAKAIYDLFSTFDPSGGTSSGGGLNSTATMLLIQILQEAIYSTNVSGKIEQLQTVLAQGGSGGSGDSGDIDTPTTSDDITVADGIMTIVSVGSEISVADNIMTIL